MVPGSLHTYSPRYDSSLMNVNLLNEISQAETMSQLKALRSKLGADSTLWEAYDKRQLEIEQKSEQSKEIGKECEPSQKTNEEYQQLQQEYNQLKGRISSFVDSDGKSLTDLSFATKVREQIPPNTYLAINVTTLAEYQFVHSLTKARKIELIREEWGVFNIPFFDSIQAGCSAAFKGNSIYRKGIEGNMLMAGILASTELTEDKKEEFNMQVIAAYWSGKRIEIIVPFDFSENGVVKIESLSKVLTFAIDSGRWFRSLFKKD